MKIILFFSFFLVSYNTPKIILQNDGVPSKQKRLPVWITYPKYSPPDSIKEFLKIYMQTKNINIIEQKEAIDLVMQQMQTPFADNLPSGNMSAQDYIQKNSTILNKPVCNVLGIHLFIDKQSVNDFLIDSIQWFIKVMPTKDTDKVYQHFYPSPEIKQNLYTVLKSFSDTVLFSGQFK